MDLISLPSAYRLADGPPSVADYLELRGRAGLTPKREDQARAALGGSWAAVHAVHEVDDRTVAMGRLLGDGGWYFHVVDMAVLPEHQRKGLGDAILTFLLERIRREAPAGAFVNLITDPPGRRLYARHGFTPMRRTRSAWLESSTERSYSVRVCKFLGQPHGCAYV